MKTERPSWLIAALATLLGAAAPDLALATAGPTALPYEGPLLTLVGSLTGPFAYAASVVGLAAVGAMWLFGGEMTAVGRGLLSIVVVIGFLVGIVPTLSALFGVTSAVGDFETLAILMLPEGF